MAPDQCGTGEFGEWWAGMPGLYEGDGTEGTEPHNRKEKTMKSTQTTGDGRGYERWLAAREVKAATDPTTEKLYASYLDLATGERAQRKAGVPESGLAGVGRVDLSQDSDDVVYEQFRAELDGSAARRRTEEAARLEREDRAAEYRRHSRETGSPMPALYDDDPGAA